MKNLFKLNFKSAFLFLLAILSLGSMSLAHAEDKQLLGAGASFPDPVYSRWASLYRVEKDIFVNYQSIGSGGGVKQISKRLVDFGASDYPLKAKDHPEQYIQMPVLGGGIVIAYNLPEFPNLVLSGEIIAKIYLGEITHWNDPAIKKLNPQYADKLPRIYIAVLFRSDGSGTTYNFTKYLATVYPPFQSKLGFSKAVNFSVGLGGKGNEGVAAVMPRVYGSIGYLEFGYALKAKVQTASLINKSGNIVQPSSESFTAALTNVDWSVSPKDLNVADPLGSKSWPINAVTFALIPKDSQRMEDIKDFFSFGMLEHQEDVHELHYVPLPTFVAEGYLEQLTTQ